MKLNKKKGSKFVRNESRSRGEKKPGVTFGSWESTAAGKQKEYRSRIFEMTLLYSLENHKTKCQQTSTWVCSKATDR